MAIFEENDNSETGWNSVEYSLLQKGSITLFYKDSVLEETIELLKDKKYVIKKLNCSKLDSELIFHEEVAKVLEFSSYYGENLDAFNDCISTLDIPFFSGYVIVFTQFNLFSNLFPKMAWSVLGILERNSRDNLLFGKRLFTLIQSDEPNIHFEPLGAQLINWNQKEWFNKDRGL
jgi:RNAse (barnase) inhibitor barstar